MITEDDLALYALAPIGTIDAEIKRLNEEFRQNMDYDLNKLDSLEEMQQLNEVLQELHEDINKLVKLRKKRLK